SLDRDQPKVVSVVADLAHLVSASVWLGGLAALFYVVPRATQNEDERRAAARAFSSAALPAVVVLALTGLARALTELSAVSQIWATSYGRALIVKSAIFVAVLGGVRPAPAERAARARRHRRRRRRGRDPDGAATGGRRLACDCSADRHT